MALYFVTGNDDKFFEIKRILDKIGIDLKQSKINIVEKKYDTEKEVSIGKALAAVKQLNAPVIVEDTGIYFEDYNNFPGPNAHVFFDGVGHEGVLKILEGKKRGAYFRTSVAFCKPGSNPVCFIGECKGQIAEKISDVIDFAYDSLFVPDGDKRTFSEMTKEEKDKFSHRRKAIEEFIKWYGETQLNEKA
ncbi:MAG: RdgB/HAM1 family non-canonical purine NTP pyrophosphatase [Nanoarchaeota archaeon]|nr:RdgB/HAM1 family non-canonical purine NTP pyrophosphatase [Nanoarchaeota archaeon]